MWKRDEKKDTLVTVKEACQEKRTPDWHGHTQGITKNKTAKKVQHLTLILLFLLILISSTPKATLYPRKSWSLTWRHIKWIIFTRPARTGGTESNLLGLLLSNSYNFSSLDLQVLKNIYLINNRFSPLTVSSNLLKLSS